MIAHGATNWNDCLREACRGGHMALAELMIAHGATDWDEGLLEACRGGHIELANMVIVHGAADWNAACFSRQNMKEYIKAQRKLHDAKSVPIIRMLRRYAKYLRNIKRIQQWWRGTYPLWRELAYAPPNGIRYRQSLTHFEKNLNILKKIENSKK